MKTIKNVIILSCLLIIAACQSGQHSPKEIPVAHVRKAMQSDNPITLKNDVESIEYIPLETNDSCLISNLLNLQVTKDFLFLYNGKTGQILQLDKQGKFIQNIAHQGSGPGEYGMISELTVDNNRNELSIFQYGGSTLIYSLKGDYLRSDTTMKHASGMFLFSDGKSALKGLIMSPIQQAPWAGALMSTTGKLEEAKSLYPTTIDRDVLYMKELCFSPSTEGVLLYTACNDTVFRISSSGIKPACILKRENAQNYYDGIADINRLRDNTVEDDETIGVYDLFESSNYIYLRLYKGDGIYLQQFNKNTGELKSHRVSDDYVKCSEAIPGNNVIGLDNDIDNGVPFWPEYTGYNDTRIQVVSSHSILSLRDKGYLNDAPSVLNITDDSNPVIIIYSFKK